MKPKPRPLSAAKPDDLYAPGGTVPLSAAAREAHVRCELAARNLEAARRMAKVTTCEQAKSGNHVVLVLPDAHFPFNDPAATDLVIKIAEVIRPSRIVSLGDTIEAAAWTMHSPRSYAEEATHAFSLEIAEAGAWIDRVRRAAAVEPSWAYLEGNHEAHVERECIRLGAIGRAVADLVSPKRLLMRTRPWMSWTPYVKPYSQGRPATSHPRGGGLAHHKITSDLWAVHGWSIAKNAAQKHLDMMRGSASCVFGHVHKMQSVTEHNIVTDKLVRAWSTGCLSNLQPPWMATPTTWSHGVSAVFCEDACLRRPDPKWTAYPIEIDRGGCVLPRGTSIRV